MKKIHFVALILLLFIGKLAIAQNLPSDKIVGIWLTAEKDAKIEIYKAGGKYNGKILSGKNLYEANGKTLSADVKNPDEKLRNRTILNLEILTGFIYADNEWKDGKIYDPKSGKTYSATMKLSGKKLDLRGYIGISMFGRTTTWERFQ